jgi:hypothetical protein
VLVVFQQANGDTSQCGASPSGAADNIEVDVEFGWQLDATSHAGGVAAAFGHDVAGAELLGGGNQYVRLGLAPVGAPVQVGQAHAAAGGVSQRLIER